MARKRKWVTNKKNDARQPHLKKYVMSAPLLFVKKLNWRHCQIVISSYQVLCQFGKVQRNHGILLAVAHMQVLRCTKNKLKSEWCD
jgi:hypothetical protein